MTRFLLTLLVGLFFVVFSLIALWFLRREYRLRRKLTWAGSIVHVAMYAVHGMVSGLLAWGTDSVPAMGPFGAAGIVLIVIGLCITFYAMDLFRTFSRWLGNDTPGLSTRGLYRFSRNPQFVGYGLVILGFFVAWWTPFAIFGLLSYAALVYAVARIEEEHLARIYGQSYLDYCARTPRFIGVHLHGPV